MAAHPFTPTTAVERLVTHGVVFTDAQLALVSDECTVSGFRRIQSGFEDCRTTGTNPAYRPCSRTVELPARPTSFLGWLGGTWRRLRRQGR